MLMTLLMTGAVVIAVAWLSVRIGQRQERRWRDQSAQPVGPALKGLDALAVLPPRSLFADRMRRASTSAKGLPRRLEGFP